MLEFIGALEKKVAEQLKSQKVGYLLGAGSSYLDGAGYPLAYELWDVIKDGINDVNKRADIQSKLDDGALGIEHALDLLDDGAVNEPPYRHLVTAAIADLFRPMHPSIEFHAEFVRRLSLRSAPAGRERC